MAIPSQYAFIVGTNDFYIGGTKLDDTCTGTKRADNQEVYPFTKGNLYSQSFNSSSFNKYRETPSGQYTSIFGLDGITKIEVTEGESNVSVTYTLVAPYQRTIKIPNTSYYYAGCTPNGNLSNGYISVNGGQYWNDTSGTRYNTATFTTLLNALNYIYQHYFNIELWVNGEQWLPIPPIVYTWSSVPSISGKNGILSLSMIKDSKLGDLTGGSGLSESEYMDRFTSQSNLYGYGNNMAKGDEITIAYSGENYLNLYKDNTGYLYLKFYFRSGVLIYTSPQFVTYPTSPKYLCMVIDEEQHVVQPIVVTYYPSSDTVEWSSYNPSDTEMSALYSWLQYGTPEASPYLQGSSDNGGDNYHLTPQDDFTSNLFPNLTGLATHLFTVYCPTDSQLQSLSNFLWSDDLISNIKKYFGNVSEAIVSLYMLPYKPSGLPTKKFKIGSVTYDDGPSDVEYLDTTRYVTVSMGSFPIDPVFDSYLDYEPYTKLSIYLPFIGIQQLSVDEFMCKAEMSGALSESTGSTIDIEYRIDLLTGGCVAYIKQGTQVKYQFSGKCGATLPISGQNYNSMVGGLVQAISGFATTIASGGLTAPMSISGAVSGTVNAMKPDLFKAGNLSGELSLLSYNRPMIIKTRPNINIDMADQIKVDGLPSYKVKTIGSYSGFISCIAVHVDGINCTQEEKDKIHSYLLEGVIV